jgi:serine/threonine-protein kinase
MTEPGSPTNPASTTLRPGMEIGSYRLSSKIGEGGMGVVWRAEDTALGRDVALRFLPGQLVEERERLARFRRAAQSLAALNHPNIASIYGFHEEGGRPFLAMELVPGEDLARLLAAGRLPVKDAVAIARQVAEGMEAAHDAGFVHRDLKPANILVTPAGQVRILDIGLARALEGEGSAVEASMSPTLTTPATRDGVILGTAAFMSPEQARGRPVDRRTDIWAFGTILFEMLSGARAFTGETVSDTVAAILRTEPDRDRLPATTPPALRRLIGRCLEKDPRRRLRDMGEARIALEDVAAGAGRAGLVSATPATGKIVVIALGFLALVAVAFLAGANMKRGAGRLEVVKFTVPLGSEDHLLIGSASAAFSPDGRRLAYTLDRLYLRVLDQTESHVLPGTDRARKPAWSPDGEWIAYGSGRRLLKIAASGGSPIQIAELPREFSYAGGICWLPDDRILFTTGDSGLLQVPAQGGHLESWADPREGEDALHNCAMLPGGAMVLTIPHDASGEHTISLVGAMERRDLITEPEHDLATPAWSPSGHILYRRNSLNPGIWARPFSLREMKVTGQPFLVAPDGFSPAPSTGGALAYFTSKGRESEQLVQVDREGRTIRTIASAARFSAPPQISPDGRYVAFQSNASGSTQVIVRPFPTGEGQSQMSNEEGDRVFFLGSGRMWETEIRFEPRVSLGTPVALFSPEHLTRTFVLDWPAPFDVSGRGDQTRFYLTRREIPVGTDPPALVVALNWAEEFRAGE